MPTDDRLDMMTLFVRIADTGRLAEASRQLGMSQPSASRMLRRLERLLGVELVRRSTRGLSLTDEGRRFTMMARSLLENWQLAVEAVQDDAAHLKGPLRIVVPVAIGQNLLASIFAAFGRRHPDVTIECDLSDDPADLSTRGYDLQVRAGPVPHQSLIVRELWYVERALIARAGHPAADHPASLSHLPAARLTTFVPPTVELTHENGQTTLLEQRTVFASDNLYTILTAVREGLGFTIAPLWATQRDIEDGTLVRLCAGWRPSDVVVSLVYPPSSLRPKRLEALLRFLRHELTAETGLGVAFLEAGGARPYVRRAAAANGTSVETQS